MNVEAFTYTAKTGNVSVRIRPILTADVLAMLGDKVPSLSLGDFKQAAAWCGATLPPELVKSIGDAVAKAAAANNKQVTK